MADSQLARLGFIRDTFAIADGSLDRARLHVPHVLARMTRAARVGHASPRVVELAFEKAKSAGAALDEGRVDISAAKHALMKAVSDLRDENSGKSALRATTAATKSIVIAYGDVEECETKGRAARTGDIQAVGDDCPPPGERGLTVTPEIVAMDRAISRELNLAEQLIDRALLAV